MDRKVTTDHQTDGDHRAERGEAGHRTDRDDGFHAGDLVTNE